jgi:thiamine biosynthesis lipoprotein
MATTFEVVVPWDCSNSDQAADAALNLIDSLEAQLTVYRTTSEVSRLNRLAVQAAVPVEQRLFELLQTAQRVSQTTGGAFDITAGPLIKAWGFFRRQGEMPTDEAMAMALKVVGMDHLHLDSVRRTVRFDQPRVEINLGSIGKGYAIDRAMERLRRDFGVGSALIHGGTSSVLALNGPWSVGVQHPWQPRRLGTVQLKDRGMASTGATHQHFAYNGKKLGHVLDPRTGWPAEGMALAVALAATAAEADALSTAFYVMGMEGARRYCQQYPGVSAILLADEPDGEPIAINCAEGEWTPAPRDDFYPSSELNDE